MADDLLGVEELAVANVEHVKRISDTFRPTKVKKKSSIPKTVVQEIWKNRLAPRFFSTMMNVMFPENSKEVSFLSFYTIYKNLAEPEAEIMFRALTIYHIATIHEPPFNYEQADEYPNAPLKNIKDYVCDVITSYLHAIIRIQMKEVLGWLDLKASNSLSDGYLAAAYLLKDLETHRNEVSIGSLEIWLEKNEIYYTVSEQLFLYLFGVNKSIDVTSLIPFPIIQNAKNCKTLLTLPDVLLLNSKFPKRAPRWTLACMLDSRSASDWDTFRQTIYGKGQTLIVVQDGNGDIFGMYGSQTWFPSKRFYGNGQCFLFTLKPDVNIYESSGRNNHFQIFTDSGIGMGGSEQHFGLFINDGAKTGMTSLSCSTFRQFWPLARELNFRIEQIELWIVDEDSAAPSETVVGDVGRQEENRDLISADFNASKLTGDSSEPSFMSITNKQTDKDISRAKHHRTGIHLTKILSKNHIFAAEKDNEKKATVKKRNTTARVFESFQKQSKDGKCLLRRGRTCEEGSITFPKDGSTQGCAQASNRDLLRSPLIESINVKTPLESQETSLFVHPSLKPKDDSISQVELTKKGQSSANISDKSGQSSGPKFNTATPMSSQIQENQTNDVMKKENINYSSCSSKNKDANYTDFIKYPFKRNGKSLVDVQVQVGQNKILRSTCRMSTKKFCACVVKSPCYCGSSPSNRSPFEEKPNELNVIAKSQNMTEAWESTVDKPASMQTVFTTAPESKLESMTVTEELPIELDRNGLQKSAENSQMTIGFKDVQEPLNLSSMGCRCSSSTESGSDWEDDTRSTVDRLKLKSECSCELNTSVLGDYDKASKYVSDTATMTQTLEQTKKDTSSSVCSCVLGPKDKGAARKMQSTISGPSATPEKENQELTRSCKKSNISFSSRGSGYLRKSVPSITSNVTNRSMHSPIEKAMRNSKSSNASLSCSTIQSSFPDLMFVSKDYSPRKNQHSITKTTNDSNMSTNSKSPNTKSRSSKTNRSGNSISLNSQFMVPSEVPSTSSHQSKHLLPLDMKKQSGLTKSFENSNSSCRSEINARSNMNIPPTCLSCRTLVKRNGCQCKTRSRSTLTPIIEQAQELLQQSQGSKRSSIQKHEQGSNSISLSSSAVLINMPNDATTGSSISSRNDTVKAHRKSRSCSCSTKADKSCVNKTNDLDYLTSKKDTTITALSAIIETNKDSIQTGSTGSVKKTCQCSLPKSCFPQFPEDDIRDEDSNRMCGCGSHDWAVIRFPKFSEPLKEPTDPVDNKVLEAEKAAALEGNVEQESVVKKRESGECPCSEQDGTIIILNVAKCNTMEALEKIVQELDVKYHPVMPQGLLPMPTDGAVTKSKPCSTLEPFDKERIVKLLNDKLKGTPIEQNELHDQTHQ